MYSGSGELDNARSLFEECFSVVDIVSWTSLVTGYSNSRNIDVARKYFDEMPQRNTVSWNAMVAGYARSGQIMKARELFDEMPAKDVASWSVMISGYSQSGMAIEALGLFQEMVSTGVMPNESALVSAVSACAQLRALDQGEWLHNYIKEQMFEVNVILGTALLDMYGMVHEGHQIYNIMTQVYQIKPQLEHYGCMVDLLGRAGLIKEALEFVEKMPVEPHPGLWGALASACRIHGEIELGEELGKHLIKLESKHSGRYMLLLNMFAAANRWDDVVMMRNLLKKKKVLKNPGNSIIKL
ncbi:Pentatricopeptide repeat-containing protein [Thalictrum thalictroides]|uniref:Pentatricopeptide repeat-containing protein n=1 Tax=Thalictrum thalictroides TaxID=46969 RepID=A0A7J6VA67_THATH|nr:Pentatricopeptide repeat-containing protein [Thalictrum thalictroides]